MGTHNMFQALANATALVPLTDLTGGVANELRGVSAAAQNALTAFTLASVLGSIAFAAYIVGFVEQKLIWLKSVAALVAANPWAGAGVIVLLLAHAYFTAKPLGDVHQMKLTLRLRINDWKTDLQRWIKTRKPAWQMEASLLARLAQITKDVTDKAKEVAFQQTIFHDSNGIIFTMCMVGCSPS